MLAIDFTSLPERFREKIHIEPNSDCWLWIAGGHGRGYGGFAVDHETKVYAHRFAYVFFYGEVPDGLQLDHLCENKRCVNPKHLEAVIGQLNTMRGMGFPILDGRHCQKGHPLFGPNLYMDGTVRRCRICGNERARKYHERKRQHKNHQFVSAL